MMMKEKTETKRNKKRKVNYEEEQRMREMINR